jgi:hypothetical protein
MRPAKWIQKVSNLTYPEILKENSEFQPEILNVVQVSLPEKPVVVESLPTDSINLFDKVENVRLEKSIC